MVTKSSPHKVRFFCCKALNLKNVLRDRGQIIETHGLFLLECIFSDGDKDGHSSAGAAGKLTTPFENLSRSLEGTGDEDSKDSFECLYIDETGAGKGSSKSLGNSSKWDTDSSIVSSESQHSKSHRRHKKDDKDRKHRRHKSKHKKKDLEKSGKHKHKGLKSEYGGKGPSSSKHDAKQGKIKSASLNDALAGALDGMEELFKSSNYAERVSQYGKNRRIYLHQV